MDYHHTLFAEILSRLNTILQEGRVLYSFICKCEFLASENQIARSFCDGRSP
jgi:hypothetical protein